MNELMSPRYNWHLPKSSTLESFDGDDGNLEHTQYGWSMKSFVVLVLSISFVDNTVMYKNKSDITGYSYAWPHVDTFGTIVKACFQPKLQTGLALDETLILPESLMDSRWNVTLLDPTKSCRFVFLMRTKPKASPVSVR